MKIRRKPATSFSFYHPKIIYLGMLQYRANGTFNLTVYYSSLEIKNTFGFLKFNFPCPECQRANPVFILYILPLQRIQYVVHNLHKLSKVQGQSKSAI